MSDDVLSPTARLQAQSALMQAYRSNDIAAMEAALANGALAGWMPPKGAPLLHEAARDNKVDAVRVLLNWGADAEMRDSDGGTPLYQACLKGNAEAAQELLEAGANYRSSAGNGHMAESLLQTARGGRDALAAVIEQYDNNRPRISPSKDPETLKERLFRFDKQHFTPLDNPQTWRDFDALHHTLMEQNTPITKDEWFDLNGEGERWIDVAVKFRALDKVLGHLHAQGERLTVDELLADKELLDGICHKGGVRHLFTREQLQGEGVEGMRRLQRAIPESAMGQVKNRFALTTSLQQDAQRTQGAGR